MHSRIQYLDGLRGIAILMVVLFHGYVRWSDRMPFGNVYAEISVLEFGWLGVQLFFLISGFVIFLTLDRTPNFSHFIYRRWLRLFPAMLLATVLIYFTAPLFHERPLGSPNLLSLLPGLSFIEPSWWSALFGQKVIPLEGAFWSLYVEFKFYVYAGLVYFVLGRRYLMPMLVFAFILPVSLSKMSQLSDVALFQIGLRLTTELSFKHFGWFAAGAAFYLYVQERKEYYFWVGILLAPLVMRYSIKPDAQLSAGFVFLFFALSIRWSLLQNFLSLRFFVLFGFISYPLYLIHENSMVAMIIQLENWLVWLPELVLPIISIIILSMVAYLMAKYAEPRIKQLIVKP